MKLFTVLSCCFFACTAAGTEIDDFFDRLDATLTTSAFHDNIRARVSGTLDLELYHFQQPASALIDAKSDTLFNPRLTLFLDAQFGSQVYVFVQSRIDRGFDPSDHGANIRLDEHAVRLTPWSDGRFTLQAGKFATVVGNFIPRHLSWENPFVTAPLVYENVIGIRDDAAPASRRDFLRGIPPHDKYEFNPVIWGPSYTSGVSLSGRLGRFDYAAELKNSSLASRPESWDVTEVGFEHPTFNGRFGFRPDQIWNVGVSASDGPYFRPEAAATLPAGRAIGDYHERVIGQDVSFAWHHLQLWAELYETRFEVPRVGDADTLSYYLEAKYKFAPQFFGALRWNQQLFGEVGDGNGGHAQWGDNIWRIDAAGSYRLNPYTQLKLQYSFQQETTGRRDGNHIVAAQFTVRF